MRPSTANISTRLPIWMATTGCSHGTPWIAAPRIGASGKALGTIELRLKTQNFALLLSPTHLRHSLQDQHAVAIHVIRAPLQRQGQNRGQSCRLLPANIPCRSLVVETARRLCAINARSPFHHVEVE